MLPNPASTPLPRRFPGARYLAFLVTVLACASPALAGEPVDGWVRPPSLGAGPLGRDLATGLVLDGALGLALESGLDRLHSSGERGSFLSGGTSSAFTVAPILQSRFGWKVGVPAYALAVATGLGRAENDGHVPSEVLAGAALGLAVGVSVAHHGRDRGDALRMPGHLTMGRRGLGLRFEF